MTTQRKLRLSKSYFDLPLTGLSYWIINIIFIFMLIQHNIVDNIKNKIKNTTNDEHKHLYNANGKLALV